MIVDTSAIVAILRDEPDAGAFARAIEATDERRISAANCIEAAIVTDGSRAPIASRRFDDLLREARIVVEPVTESQARIAREAYRDFGRGSSQRPPRRAAVSPLNQAISSQASCRVLCP
jgi:ribonuclease VapC